VLASQAGQKLTDMIRTSSNPGSLANGSVERFDGLAHPDYRPDIDGLRAIAVLAVIGFHAFPTWIRGGFVGVDVFFVISGYLISTILFTGMERSSFSFLQFYIRRIRRIFPALIVVLLACMVAGWFLLFSIEYMVLGKHVAGSAAFISNFVLWNEAGYFDKSAEAKPLLHIWSLGIEEQFYIVWPLLLYLTWKRKIGTLAFLLLLLVATFMLNVRTVASDAAADFYSPLTRFWELMAGAILAYLSLYKLDPGWISRNVPRPALKMIGALAAPDPATCNVKALSGLLLIAVAVVMFNGTMGYPGWWALLPVIGTYLMLAAGPDAWINSKLLAARALVAIGLISYPLYLWHWSLLSFIRIVDGQAPSPETAALAILISVVLAWLTYLFVEKPTRFGKSAPRKAVVLLAAMAMIGSAGYYTYANGGFASRSPGVEDLMAATQDFVRENNLMLGRAGADETILVGDSTLQQYIPRVRWLIEQHVIDLDRNRVVTPTLGGCPPIPDIARDVNPACAKFVDDVLPALDGSAVKTVVFGAFWTNEFKTAEYYLRSDGSKTLLRDSKAATQHALDNFAHLISRLVKAGKRVFVILETPTGAAYAPVTMLPIGFGRLIDKPIIPDDPKRSRMETVNAEFSKKIQEVAEMAGARVINPMDYLCDKEVCPVFTNGHVRYFDFDHLRASFVREHATYIDQIFQPEEKKNSPGDGSTAQ
jgi:peptidoglycan/LPS O-acetylase OafA/YrhL